MILTLRLLGLEVLHIELSQPEAAATEDPGEALSGGTVASTPISLTWVRGGMEPEAESPYED